MNQTGFSILVVDDEPLVLSTLGALLQREFEVLMAGSADSAIEILRERPVDLLLTDLKMPGISGLELLDWARQHAPRTVRMAMTGLGSLEDAVAAINTGQVHRYLTKPWHSEELLHILREAARTYALERSHEQLLQELRDLNQELEGRVRQRTAELEEANRQLRHKNLMLEKLALTDPLTGLPNRRAMERLVRSELHRRARYPAPMAVGLIDIDRFKRINTRYLLPGGDQALIGLAQTLTKSVRAVDTVGRIGGEEFLLLAPQTNEEGAAALAERIRSAVEQNPVTYKDAVIRCTVSIGVAVASETDRPSADQLRLVAAAALGVAKATGRNRCVIHRLADKAPHRVDGVNLPGTETPAEELDPSLDDAEPSG